MRETRNRQEAKARWESCDNEWAIFQEFENTFCNAFKITGLDPDVYPPFIIRGLLYDGCVAYVDHEQSINLSIEEGWYWCRPTGFNSRYGFPKSYNLVYGNYVVAKTNVFYKDFHLIHGNATHFPYVIRFLQEAKELERLRISEKINVEASRNADLIPVKNPEIRMTLERAYANVRSGVTAVELSEEAAEALQNKISNPTAFNADKIHALFEQRFTNMLKRCGSIADNDFKRERVQSAEVSASAGEAIDFAYIFIDSFNTSCKRDGLPFEMVFNGYAARFDDFDEEKEGKTE